MTTNDMSQGAGARFSKISLRWVAILVFLTLFPVLMATAPEALSWALLVGVILFMVRSLLCVFIVASFIPPPEPIAKKSAFARRVVQVVAQVRGAAGVSLGMIVAAGVAVDVESWRSSNLPDERIVVLAWSLIVVLTGVAFASKVFWLSVLTAVDVYRTPVNVKRTCIARHLRSIKFLGGGCASVYVSRLEKVLLSATTGPMFIPSAAVFVMTFTTIGVFFAGIMVNLLINAAR